MGTTAFDSTNHQSAIRNQQLDHEQRIRSSYTTKQCDKGVSHRRSRNACVIRYPPGHSAWRIRFHRWTIGLRQDDLVVNSGVARYSFGWQLLAERTRSCQSFFCRPRPNSKPRNRFIFQSFNLIGDLSVFENVELPLTYRGMASSERKSFVTQALERVGMAHRAKHLPSQLSGGQQQRVAVARALAGKPAILLADEPTGNLDSRNGEAVMQLLKEL